MYKPSSELIQDVALPWSDGLLTSRMWRSGRKIVVSVPELGLHCYGNSQSEAVFRLFSCLVKYYRQLKTHPDRLTERAAEHMKLLSGWIASVEERVMLSSSPEVASVNSRT